jgi:hypothetical protein
MARHSGIGVASFITSVAVGVLMIGTLIVAGLMALSTSGGMTAKSAGPVMLGLSFVALLFADIVALALGIGGLCQSDCRRTFAVLGTVLSSGTIVLVVSLAVIGNLKGARPSGHDGKLVVHKDPLASQFTCDVKYATFQTPAGWRPNRSGGNTYAILSRTDESYPNLTQMISIDVGKPVEPTAKAMANAFAKKWNGRVAELSLTIDGVEGFRVTIPPDKKTVQPTDCMVTVREGRAFLLIGGAKEGGDVSRALDEVLASWRWKR